MQSPGPFSPIKGSGLLPLPGSPDHSSSPYDDGGGGGGAKSFLSKKEPNPFYNMDLHGDVNSQGSTVSGNYVSWKLKGEVPIEDMMYPSLHTGPALAGGVSFAAVDAEGSPVRGPQRMSSLAKSKGKLSKQKKTGRRQSTLQRTGETAVVEGPRDYEYNPHDGVRWEVNIGPTRSIAHLEAKDPTPAEQVDKDMDEFGEKFLRNRLKRNFRRGQSLKEEKRKIAEKREGNLLFSDSGFVVTPSSMVYQRKEEFEAKVHTLEDQVAHDEHLEHLRAEEHSYTQETPDGLYSSLVESHNVRIEAMKSGIMQKYRPGSPEAKKQQSDVNKGYFLKHKVSLSDIQGSKDHAEMEDGLLFYRLRNDLHKPKGTFNFDDANPENAARNAEAEAVRRRLAKVQAAMTRDRVNIQANGAHLRRGARQTSMDNYKLDNRKHLEEFDPKKPLISYSQTDRSVVDFSPIKKSPSHSKTVARDLLQGHQFERQILPEAFIMPHQRITAATMKAAVEEEKVREGLSPQDRKMRKRLHAEQRDAHFTVDMNAYGVGDEQGLCLGRSLLNFTSLEKLILAENRLTAKSLPTIMQNINADHVLYINLSSNKLSGKVCAGAFKNFLKSPHVCTHLNLSKCGLRCADLVSICDGLLLNIHSPLEELILADNKIEHIGAKALSVVLCRIMTADIDPMCFANKTEGECISKITTVNLGWNNLATIGTAAIAYAITISNLKNLDLSGNGVSDNAAQRLAAAFSKTKTLEVVNLQQNNVKSPACFVFANVLNGHASMTVLDLSLNPVGEPGARILFRTILNGLKCFVMMRSCTFLVDDSIFNHSNPAADSPYDLDLSIPYDEAVANTLQDMMEKDPENCKITDASYKVTPKSPSSKMGLVYNDGEVCEKATGKRWKVPDTGTMDLFFAYTERIPTQAQAMSDHAIFVLQIIIVTARTEGDRRNWLKLLIRDIFCTTAQAQGIINHFVDKQVIGIGGLKKVDVIIAIWSRLLDPENMVQFFLRNIDTTQERKKVILGMGFDLFKFNWVNPTGHWRFNLENENQRIAMLKFITINAIESEFSENQSQRDDTSQMEDWSNFRNASYEGGEREEDDENADALPTDKSDTEKFIFKPFQINRKFRDNLPYVGIVEFDYVSTRRPLQGADKEAMLSSGRTENSGESQAADADEGEGFWLEEDGDDNQDVLENSGGSASSSSIAVKRERQGSVTGEKIAVRDSSMFDDIGNGSASGSAGTSNANTRPGSSISRPGSSSSMHGTVPARPRTGSRGALRKTSVSRRAPLKKVPADFIITEGELFEMLHMLNLTTRQRIEPPDTYLALAYLQLAATKYYFLSKQVNTVLECFSRSPAIQARVVVVMFSRIWDLHNMDVILRALSTASQKETISRLGYLNVINPLKPAMDFEIDMRYVDARKCLVFCLETAPSEDASQLRGDSRSDLTLTDMYSSINRVYKNCLDANVIFNYGEVGVRTVHVSWNLRLAALSKFLVGTHPQPKGMQRIIWMYSKMQKEGVLGSHMGPIESQYEFWLKRLAEEEEARKIKKARMGKMRGLLGAAKAMS